MNLSNYTIKAQEVIQQAQQIAFNHQHANIETEHILKAVLEQQDSPAEWLLKKNGVNIINLTQQLHQQIEKLPKAQGVDPVQQATGAGDRVAFGSPVRDAAVTADRLHHQMAERTRDAGYRRQHEGLAPFTHALAQRRRHGGQPAQAFGHRGR